MKYAKHGDLQQYMHVKRLRFLHEEDVGTIAVQVLEALSFLSTNPVLHRDLKPKNILVLREHPLEVKLADFGLSRMLGSQGYEG